MREDEEVSLTALIEERVRLERESIAVERERLAAARAHVDASAQLLHAHRPVVAVVIAVLLSLLCFTGGLLSGMAIVEGRYERRRAERLSRALSQLDDIAAGKGTVITNAPSQGPHRNVSVVVFE